MPRYSYTKIRKIFYNLLFTVRWKAYADCFYYISATRTWLGTRGRFEIISKGADRSYLTFISGRLLVMEGIFGETINFHWYTLSK